MIQTVNPSFFVAEHQVGACLLALHSAGVNVEKGEVKHYDKGNVVRIHYAATDRDVVRQINSRLARS